MQWMTAYDLLQAHLTKGWVSEDHNKIKVECNCGWKSQAIDQDDPKAAHLKHLQHVARVISKGGK